LRLTNPSICKPIVPLIALKDMSRDSNASKPRKVGKTPSNKLSLKFNRFKPFIFPHSVMKPSGIELRRFWETSRYSKVSILQTRGRKSEELSEKADKEIPTTEELARSPQLTPFHAHGSEPVHGSLAGRLFERLFMASFWVCDSRENTMGEKQKRRKTTISKYVEGWSYLPMFLAVIFEV